LEGTIDGPPTAKDCAANFKCSSAILIKKTSRIDRISSARIEQLKGLEHFSLPLIDMLGAFRQPRIDEWLSVFRNLRRRRCGIRNPF